MFRLAADARLMAVLALLLVAAAPAAAAGDSYPNGSGKRVTAAFNNSAVIQQYSLGFLNPYFTPDGISAGYDLSYTKRNAGTSNIQRYYTATADAGVNFGIPLNEFDRLRFNFDVKHTSLTPDATLSSAQILDFTNPNGAADPITGVVGPCTLSNINCLGSRSYLTFSGGLSWTHITLNRMVMPTSGGQQSFSATSTIPGSDLLFYKLDYNQQHYFPLAKDLTIRLRGEIAYGRSYGKHSGDTVLPFFENFYNGGVRSVRGFVDNTLGPRDSMGYAMGGSTKVLGNAELFFPVPFVEDLKSVRIGAFFDAGSVADNFSFGPYLRYSAGLSAEWLSPFGALAISIAKPLNSGSVSCNGTPAQLSGACIDANGNPVKVKDSDRMFQFTFGQTF